jgi:hypothetical protein
VEKGDYKKLNKNPSFRDILQFYTEDRILSKTTFLDLGLPTVSTTIPHGYVANALKSVLIINTEWDA